MTALWYRGLMATAPFWALPFFLLRRRGRARIMERVGGWEPLPERVLWLHAASVGEANGIVPLIDSLRNRYPALDLLCTCVSVTGLERLEQHFKVAPWLHLRLLPFDHAWFVARALRRTQPIALISAEAELWPGIFQFLKQRNVRVALVNARLSERALRRLCLSSSMRRALVDAISYVAAQHSEAAGRYARLGVPSERIRVTGNTKYDQPVSEVTSDERRQLRHRLFGDNRPVLVLGSVRPGEELQWLAAIRAVQARALLGVVLAPRHEEKFDYFADVLSREGFSFQRWSEMRDDKISGVSTVLLDTMGQLAEMYAIADLAFVGGSLVDHGGHNPLEPAAYGTPVCMGPFCRNAHDVVQLLREADAIIDLPEGEAAGPVISTLLEALMSTGLAREELRNRGERARTVWSRMQGSVSRTIAALEEGGVLRS